MKLDPSKALTFIAGCTDKKKLRQLRTNVAAHGYPELIAAVDDRIGDLNRGALSSALGVRMDNGTLIGRVWESVRIYEELLQHKHGRQQRASRTRAAIARHGEMEAVRRTVATGKASTGLALLNAHNRLDCSYEQIVLDFPNEFDASTRAKAQAILERLHSETPTT